tara:strand:- start:56050 stop:60141 length:4092 start_codon:yes stop_codon:yes gene_type:complete
MTVIKTYKMKNNMTIKQLFLLFVFLFIINLHDLKAQTFNRIESVAGLSLLEENNGIAIADYNKDGFLDMFVVALGKDEDGVTKSHSRLLKNNNDGTFTDTTESAGLLLNLFPLEKDGTTYDKVFEGVKHGAFWGDYDNDGYPDLFMTNVYQIYLFHNQGNGTFINVTEQAGLNVDSRCINTGATWFDYNKDGYLDLYISDWKACDSNSFYTNNGDGTFTNQIDLFGDVEHKNSLMSIPFDFNNDGWMDLYLANDVINRTNDLFINQNGKGFTEESNKYGLNHARNDMGIAFGDYNNDGFFDMYITDVLMNPLLTNKGDNTFIDLAVEQGVQSGGWSWDTVFSDFDLDGDEDLLVLNGFEYKGHNTEKNIYFQNLHANGDSKFIDKSESSNLGALTISVGAGVFDFDNDGDEDIFITNADRPSFFYENSITDFTNPTKDLHWLKVNLEGTTSNRDAIGTKLVLKTNKSTFSRYYTGKGFLSQNLKSVHFGLADATQIQELKITWPSGAIETYTNLPIDKTINFIEGSNYTTPTNQPSIKTYGCMDPNACNFNPYATISSGNCIYLKTKSTIYGNSDVLQSSIETYSYPPEIGNTTTWTIEGGEIIEGNNTNTIKVKWNNVTEGRIILVEHNNYCASENVILKVTLRSYNNPDTKDYTKSVARLWNEALLEAIRNDYARPTVHARNLFHTSIAMYDAWAVYNEMATPYLLGKQVHEYTSEFNSFKTTEPVPEAINKTISYAAYTLLKYRFKNSPHLEETYKIFEDLMEQLGYSTTETSTNYSNGDPIALGNFIAKTIIEYGLTDGSNEVYQYSNQYYTPINAPLLLNNPDLNKNTVTNPNRWQPLSFDTFIDQSGNLIPGATPDFLGPEWGNVKPFNLSESEKTTYTREGNTYLVYDDPGTPPQLDLEKTTASSDAYKWNFSLVSIWSSHHNPYDNVMWDISPKSIGNINFELIPQHYEDYPDFYLEEDGGDISLGHTINPYTNSSYQEQIVPRGDYTRVLAEFWADGPDSETPPGHWFTLLNYVSDHELFDKKLNGTGKTLSNLEWDVKSYFILGGAMHDAAIASWSIKGWYDYIRPISAIRFMAEKGQSSDLSKSNYNVAGIPLKPGYIETVETGDLLAGDNNENVGKIKVYAWKGHDFIKDNKTDEAGVDWILAQNWWPYQRPSFVTPPFAGYVSGHSTYSRAAAEVMTLLTGSEYFPGGMGEFLAKKDEFLAFEKGPSIDITLQWATYQDASDQCSLSRIWGGIHPPADDIAGRIIGERIGKNTYSFSLPYFSGESSTSNTNINSFIFPNPINTSEDTITVTNTKSSDIFLFFDINGRHIPLNNIHFLEGNQTTSIKLPNTLKAGLYFLNVNSKTFKILVK